MTLQDEINRMNTILDNYNYRIEDHSASWNDYKTVLYIVSFDRNTKASIGYDACLSIHKSTPQKMTADKRNLNLDSRILHDVANRISEIMGCSTLNILY